MSVKDLCPLHGEKDFSPSDKTDESAASINAAPQRYSFMVVGPIDARLQYTTTHDGEWVRWEDIAPLFATVESPK